MFTILNVFRQWKVDHVVKVTWLCWVRPCGTIYLPLTRIRRDSWLFCFVDKNVQLTKTYTETKDMISSSFSCNISRYNGLRRAAVCVQCHWVSYWTLQLSSTTRSVKETNLTIQYYANFRVRQCHCITHRTIRIMYHVTFNTWLDDVRWWLHALSTEK